MIDAKLIVLTHLILHKCIVCFIFLHHPFQKLCVLTVRLVGGCGLIATCRKISSFVSLFAFYRSNMTCGNRWFVTMAICSYYFFEGEIHPFFGYHQQCEQDIVGWNGTAHVGEVFFFWDILVIRRYDAWALASMVS